MSQASLVADRQLDRVVNVWIVDKRVDYQPISN